MRTVHAVVHAVALAGAEGEGVCVICGTLRLLGYGGLPRGDDVNEMRDLGEGSVYWLAHRPGGNHETDAPCVPQAGGGGT